MKINWFNSVTAAKFLIIVKTLLNCFLIFSFFKETFVPWNYDGRSACNGPLCPHRQIATFKQLKLIQCATIIFIFDFQNVRDPSIHSIQRRPWAFSVYETTVIGVLCVSRFFKKHKKALSFFIVVFSVFEGRDRALKSNKVCAVKSLKYTDNLAYYTNVS